MTDKQAPKLLPCWFCGCEPEVHWGLADNPNEIPLVSCPGVHFVRTSDENLHMQTCPMSAEGYANWNALIALAGSRVKQLEAHYLASLPALEAADRLANAVNNWAECDYEHEVDGVISDLEAALAAYRKAREDMTND